MGKGKFRKMGLEVYPKRGEIYLVCLDPVIGSEINKTRPALILSNDINNQYSETVTVIPITSNISKIFPFEVMLSRDKSGLTKDSKAKCNQIRTIDKQRMVKNIGKVIPDIMKEIEKALLIHLGFSYKR